MRAYYAQVKRHARWEGHNEDQKHLKEIPSDRIKMIKYIIGKGLISTTKMPVSSWNWIQQENLDKDPFFSGFMLRYYAAVGDDDKVEEWFRKLVETPDAPKSSKSFTEAINSFRKTKKYELAEYAFSQLINNNVKKGLNVYLVMIHVKSESGKVEEMFELFEQMKADKLETLEAYNMMMAFSAKAGRTQKALDYNREMQSRGFKPDEYTYMTLMEIHVALKHKSKIQKLYAEMLKNNIKLTTRAFNSLFLIDNEENDDSHVSNMLNEMKKHRVTPTVDNFNVIIDHFGRKRQFHLVKKYFDKISREYRLTPDLITYSTLINVHAGAQNNQEATFYLKEMLSKGFLPNTYVLSSLLKMITSIEELEKLMESIAELQVEPSTAFYNAVVKTCIIELKPSYASKVLESMHKHKIPFDSYTFGVLLQHHSHNLDMVEKIRQEMKEKNVSLTTYLYNSLMNVYGSHNQLEEMRNLFTEMCNKGFTPNSVTFNNIVRHHSRNKADFLFVVKKAKEYDVVLDDHSWNNLVRAYAVMNGVQKTREWISTSKLPTNIGIFSGLISVYCTNIRFLSTATLLEFYCNTTRTTWTWWRKLGRK